MTPSQYRTVRNMIEARLGILVPDGSELHVESRILKLAQSLGIASVIDFFQAFGTELVPDPAGALSEAMMDKETEFFRDMADFGALQKSVLPTLVQRRAGERRLSFWSAGCAGGQEPYSIAIFIREHFPELLDWDLKIYATDVIEDNAVKARQACYTKDEVNHGLPAPLLIKYFTKIEGEWQLNEPIRLMVDVRKNNLTEPTAQVPPIDVIFLRHVLENLNGQTQERILNTIGACITPNGCLFVTESKKNPPGLDNRFHRIDLPGSSFYRPKTYVEAG